MPTPTRFEEEKCVRCMFQSSGLAILALFAHAVATYVSCTCPRPGPTTANASSGNAWTDDCTLHGIFKRFLCYAQVKPYYFDFKCHVKQRWEGKSLIDVVCCEFPARTRQYYEQALVTGRLRIEGQEARADTLLRSGMCMRHFIHRHEPPVPAGEIKVRPLAARSE